MADYEDTASKTIKEVGEALTGEGLAVAGGLVLASFLGRQVQNMVKTDAAVTAAPTLQNYAYAWGGNNLPKLAGWYLLRNRATTEMTKDIKKAFAGSVVFDTVMRLTNNGTNPSSATIGGYEVLGNGSDSPRMIAGAGTNADVQRLIQENTALRTELNKALQQAAAAGIVPLPDPATRQRRYGSMEEQLAAQAAAAAGLQTPPGERQRRFGSMAGEGAMSDLTARFGML